ncbi:BMFP domain-containing protein YqiC [Breznakia sp. PF5-3]|uniref:DUF3284 domain-containing protein n=1 Tax=unclassified Breznakia TaxID=2623764 RepID=UPI0024049253|nr:MULTISPECIES: DUF3284 domain-containing protein [unclassified Breznakia]MDL2276580.1 DUF3284 domain-containing protein [Breznakia sp. OttesenSCG-928-G09]MDF9823850.1 BMFP domain-containing protein YqiC [Breznakia sp. PM6-1]MDF9834584.1 BMFP domain-containing protein YqiC [Breznakia sp. PF5-3]MDF9836799.1 BMFP domain-containing protein YqiC [Breznakia sp. PFB2-8]MDF9858752.1 BMFP domain-containing protein YqiC [Breznakia sp. PH5-24]
MIVKKKMQITPEAYFEFIMEHLLAELPKSMQKKITKKDIKKGLKYRQTYKLAKGDFVSKKEIVEFEYGVVYKLQMDIPDGYQYIEHRVKKLSDNEIEVSYEESLDSSKASTSLFHKMKARSNKKQMLQRLAAIEEYIIGKKEEAE